MATSARTSATALAFMTNKATAGTMERFRSIHAQVQAGTPCHLLLDGATPGIEASWRNFLQRAGIKAVTLNTFNVVDIAAKLGVQLLEPERLVPGSAHLPLTWLARRLSHKHYWFVEDDVVFTGNWSHLIQQYANVSADLLCSHLCGYRDHPNWNWWRTLKAPQDALKGIDPMALVAKGFFPVHRISAHALAKVNEYQHAGWAGHMEVLIPTALRHAGYRVMDLNRAAQQPVYFAGALRPDQGPGRLSSLRWRPDVQAEEIARAQMPLIFHPVKTMANQERALDDGNASARPAAAAAEPASSGPARFCLIRVVGNSLPPRHSPGNNIRSVDYIIRNEPRFEDTRRLWILNKLTEQGERSDLIWLLENHGEQFVELPFDAKDHFEAFLDATGLPDQLKSQLFYGDRQSAPLITEWIVRHKSQRLVGINQARNRALELGRMTSEWTLVLDGGVIFPRKAWEAFREAVGAAPEARFAIIPMTRAYDWQEADRQLNGGNPTPAAGEHTAGHQAEPQLAIHRDAEEVFDERLRYGHRNKAELLARIGVEGPWMHWTPAPWDSEPPLPAPNRGRLVVAGSVMRLPAEGATKEVDDDRYESRFEGLAARSLELDLRYAVSIRREEEEFNIDVGPWRNCSAMDGLAMFAEGLLNIPDRFVTGKAKPGPSGSPHDYYSLPPYTAADGTYTDGRLQHPASADDDPASGRFDRRSLALFAMRSYGLALGGRMLQRRDFLAKAAELLRLWLIEPATRMNPTARYAQFMPGLGQSNDVGIVEFRHLMLLPYAVRILEQEKQLTADQVARIRTWFTEFLRDCEASGTIGGALKRDNNIGVWAAALFCSSALFVGEFGNGFYLARTAPIRLARQLGPLSMQPLECGRTRPLHYSLFNLSAWLAMSRAARQFGIHLEAFKGVRNESISAAISYCARNRHEFLDYAQDAAKHDAWIETLSRMHEPAEAERGIIITGDADLGLPPIALI